MSVCGVSHIGTPRGASVAVPTAPRAARGWGGAHSHSISPVPLPAALRCLLLKHKCRVKCTQATGPLQPALPSAVAPPALAARPRLRRQRRCGSGGCTAWAGGARLAARLQQHHQPGRRHGTVSALTATAMPPPAMQAAASRAPGRCGARCLAGPAAATAVAPGAACRCKHVAAVLAAVAAGPGCAQPPRLQKAAAAAVRGRRQEPSPLVGLGTCHFGGRSG